MRILFAPIEIASQMQILAEGFRAMGYQATTIHYGKPSYLGTINDICFGFTDTQSKLGRLARKLIFFSWAASIYIAIQLIGIYENC